MKKSMAQLLDQSSEKFEELTKLLAMLKAAAHLHQTHHWQVHGPNFKADHDLFAQIYNGTDEQVDGFAEKIAGLSNYKLLDAHQQMTMMHEFCGKWCEEMDGADNDKMAVKSLSIVREVLSQISTAKEATEGVSDGLTNMLEGMADQQEIFVYLLKQRCQ